MRAAASNESAELPPDEPRREDGERPTAVDTAEAEETSWSLRAALKRRARRRWLIGVGVTVAASGVLALVHYPLRLTHPAEIRPVVVREVRASVEGMVVETFRREGERVSRGDLLATLDASELRLRQSQVHAQLVRAEVELRRLERGGAEDELHARRAELEALRAEAAHLKDQELRRQLRSPIDGVLISWRLGDGAGLRAQAGDAVAEVAQLDRMRVEILVPEGDAEAVQVGQPVVVKMASFPGRAFTGKVDLIPLAASRDEALHQNVLRVLAHVDNPDAVLKDGMSGYAEITCAARPVLSLLVRRVVRWARVRLVI